MRKRRPQSVLVTAIVNLVFGGLLLLCGVCGALGNVFVTALPHASGAATPNNSSVEMVHFITDHVPSYTAVMVVRGVTLVVLGILILVAGVGLLSMQGWARWLAVGYAVVAIVQELIYVLYQLIAVEPVAERHQIDIMRLQPGQKPPGYETGLHAGFLVGFAAPLLLLALVVIAQAATNLVVLLMPSTGAAFAGRGRRRRDYYEEDEDYGEDEDRSADRPVRRRRPRDDEWDE